MLKPASCSCLRNKQFWLILFLDILLLVAAHLTAYWLRFEGQSIVKDRDRILPILPLLIALKLPVFFYFGLYRGLWRYTSLTDLMNITKACAVSFLLVIGTILFEYRFEGFSRAVFILDGLLTFLFIGGLRIGIRLYFQRTTPFHLGTGPFDAADRKKNLLITGAGDAADRKKNLLIIGAGDAAEKVLREIHDNRHLPYRVIGFLDDDSFKVGRMIHGVRILGLIDDLVNITRNNDCQELLIAIPSAGRKQMTRIVELCQDTGLSFKTLPGMGELINGKVSIKAIRDVSYRDLLGRPPVRLELARIEEILSGRTVLVTGAGGSIGSELCRQILRFNPGRLILFDAGEQNLYRIEMEVKHEHGFHNYVAVLGKIQNNGLLEHMFAHYRPEVIFHAAAYKHVPLVELNPWEAVSNNILASKRLMNAALRHGAERFILVSTDKAVRPTNVMGASKRVTELLMQGYCMERGGLRTADKQRKTEDEEPGCTSLARTRFMAVRFGNVLGSSGSVIPLFRRQIEIGGPVTVTDPRMTRYFMSIPEAAQLILQACSLEDEIQNMGQEHTPSHPHNLADGGEIFILEMGTPVKIDQMARDLIKLCGKEPDTEIEIKYIGLRPGEKLYEELITEGEGIVPTRHEKIMVLKPNDHKNAESAPLSVLNQQIDELKALARAHDAEGIRKKLKEIVIDYNPKESEAIL